MVSDYLTGIISIVFPTVLLTVLLIIAFTGFRMLELFIKTDNRIYAFLMSICFAILITSTAYLGQLIDYVQKFY